MSEPKRRRHSHSITENQPDTERNSDCSTPFYGSFIHVSLCCIISFIVSGYVLISKNPMYFDRLDFVKIGMYYVHFFFFLFISYLIIGWLVNLISKE